MKRKTRLVCGVIALVLALATAAPAIAATRGIDGLKFSVEVLAW
jgi:hypothetical protein